MEVCLNCGQFMVATPKDRYRRIITNVAEAYGFTYQDIMGRSKTHELVVARHHCYDSLMRCGLSYAAAGRLMDRDHTTVIYGVRQHRERMDRAEKRAKEQEEDTAHLALARKERNALESYSD